jgi:hypothetical protein
MFKNEANPLHIHLTVKLYNLWQKITINITLSEQYGQNEDIISLYHQC